MSPRKYVPKYGDDPWCFSRGLALLSRILGISGLRRPSLEPAVNDQMHWDELAQLEVNLRTLQRRLVQTLVINNPKEMSHVRAEIEALEEQRADIQSRIAKSFDVVA
jgi:hypothetical protein